VRIISKFHDYYDSVQKQGADKECVYVREHAIKLIKKQFKVWNDANRYCTTDRVRISLHLLGFCGQIVHVFRIHSEFDNTTEFFFDFDKFKEYAVQTGIASKDDFSSRRWFKSRYQEFAEQDLRPALELFHKFQVPIFMISAIPDNSADQKVSVNINLKSINYQTQVDTYTAYQSIYQYISGVLNSKENNMVQISNQDKIDKHGFDKWSFRKMPKAKK